MVSSGVNFLRLLILTLVLHITAYDPPPLATPSPWHIFKEYFMGENSNLPSRFIATSNGPAFLDYSFDVLVLFAAWSVIKRILVSIYQ
jgi:hypothetical protein